MPSGAVDHAVELLLLEVDAQGQGQPRKTIKTSIATSKNWKVRQSKDKLRFLTAAYGGIMTSHSEFNGKTTAEEVASAFSGQINGRNGT
jgi:hypothetical protein